MGKRALDGSVLLTRLPSAAGNSVLFTFDDGPNPQHTEEVLDVLEDHGARACFFLVGRYAEAHPGLAKEILARGHSVGNHSHTHPNDHRMGPGEYVADVMRCQRALIGITGAPPRLFRPIRGEVTVGSTIAGWRIGASQLLWSQEGNEWGELRNRDLRERGRRMVEGMRARDIVLLHDDLQETAELLRYVLPEIVGRFDVSAGLGTLKGN